MIFKAILLSALVLLQFSCSEFLKGKPTKKMNIDASKESLSCLKDVTKKWKSFLETEATEKEIDQVFACIDTTLNEFQSRVEGGAEAQSFTKDELFEIFTTFMKDAQISKESVHDLLVLKSAVLGGGAEKISKKEITDLRSYLLILKTEAKALIPYVQLLKFKKEPTPFSKKMLVEGFGQLNLSLKKLLKASQVYRSEYQFSDLQRLVTNLKLLDDQQGDLFGLAAKVKDLLVGNQALQSETDYTSFIDNLTEVLRLYSFHLQGYVKFELEEADTLNETVGYVESWLLLLENSLQFKRTKVISVESLDPLIKELSVRGFIPIDVKVETLLSFYKVLITRAFDAGVTGDPAGFTGLNRLHFLQIKRELAILKLYLQAIYDLKDLGRMKIADVQTHLKSFNTNQEWVKKLDDVTRKTVVTSFEELRSEFLSARPVVYRNKKMVIAVNQELTAQSWEDLARGIYAKILSRQLLMGWGSGFSSKLVLNASLSEAQLVRWYSDFKQFGIEVKSFDPRSENSGAVSFKQANLLTYSADGDDKMNFLETVQYLNLLISGGGQTLSEMRSGFEKAGCQLPEKDVFDNPWLDERCMTIDLRTNFAKYFSNLPYLVAYAKNLTDTQFFDFYYQLMSVTRVNGKWQGTKVETADLRAMSILLHYIESLYASLDIDRNGTFSAAEVRAAYPRFKDFAKKYAYDNAKSQIDTFNGKLAQTVGGFWCYSEDDLIREAFIFLVYTGQAPKQSNINLFPCVRRKALIDFYGEVNRSQIINTFKILKSVLGS